MHFTAYKTAHIANYPSGRHTSCLQNCTVHVADLSGRHTYFPAYKTTHNYEGETLTYIQDHSGMQRFLETWLSYYWLHIHVSFTELLKFIQYTYNYNFDFINFIQT